MNETLDKKESHDCKLQIPNDMLNTVLGVSTGLIFIIILVTFGIVAYG